MEVWPCITALLAAIVCNSEGSRCPLTLSLDISNGTRLADGTVVSESITYAPEVQFLNEGSLRGCVCEMRHCLRKCCERGHGMINRTCDLHEANLTFQVHSNTDPIGVPEDHFHYIHSQECANGFYRLYPAEYEEDVFYVQRDGKLLLPLVNDEGSTLTPDQYCLDFFLDDEMQGISALVCFEEEKNEANEMFSYGKVAAPF